MAATVSFFKALALTALVLRGATRFRPLLLPVGRLGEPRVAPLLENMAALRVANLGRREPLVAVALYWCGNPTVAAHALIYGAHPSTDATFARLSKQSLRQRSGKEP